MFREQHCQGSHPQKRSAQRPRDNEVKRQRDDPSSGSGGEQVMPRAITVTRVRVAGKPHATGDSGRFAENPKTSINHLEEVLDNVPVIHDGRLHQRGNVVFVFGVHICPSLQENLHYVLSNNMTIIAIIMVASSPPYHHQQASY